MMFREGGKAGLTAKQYIEAVAAEVGRVRGKGLLLSPADATLALSWHAARVPLALVLQELRKASRLAVKPEARGVAAPPFSLQLIERAIEVRARRRERPAPRPQGLSGQLREAARAKGLAARSLWEALAEAAPALLAESGGEEYWTAAVRALQAALRELPRRAARETGAALRARLAPRPQGMPRRNYRRSLQLMLLAVASDRLGVPPKAFLL
jgi:hypothetical protein